MRKQYYFVPSEGGWDAWDVDRLVERSRDLEPFDLEVASVRELDTPHWFSGSGRPFTVRDLVAHMRLINELDPSHAIILGSDGQVMDGMHRVARALLEGRATVRAVRFATQPPPDHRNVRPDQLSYAPEPPRGTDE